MALITHPGARMVLSLLATAAAVLAGLLLLANLLMSGAYAGRVPTGADAMGLVVPLALAAVAALLLPIAAGLLLANGRLAWLGGLGGWKVLVLMLGVGVAAGAVLIAWMERLGAWVMPLGLFCGVVAPLAAIALLLASAWRDGAVLQGAGWTRAAMLAITASALCGLALAAWGGVRALQHEADNQRRAHAERARREAERARREALSPVERLREDYATFSPTTPLWVFIAGLPDPIDAEARDLVIARALQVPDVDADLAGTLASDHPRYRHGAAELVRHAPDAALKPAWAEAVAASMRISAAQIAADADWLTPDEFANPDPLAHLASLVAAAARFPQHPELQKAQPELHAALAALPASASRTRALAAVPGP
jgi:hypothetical protein